MKIYIFRAWLGCVTKYVNIEHITIYIQSVWDCCIGIDDIMCDDIKCGDQHLPSVAGTDDITCDDLTYDDLNPDVCEIMVLGLMI